MVVYIDLEFIHLYCSNIRVQHSEWSIRLTFTPQPIENREVLRQDYDFGSENGYDELQYPLGEKMRPRGRKHRR